MRVSLLFFLTGNASSQDEWEVLVISAQQKDACMLIDCFQCVVTTPSAHCAEWGGCGGRVNRHLSPLT